LLPLFVQKLGGAVKVLPGQAPLAHKKRDPMSA